MAERVSPSTHSTATGNKGIACGLTQKIADGEPLGGHVKAAVDFADGDDDDDDFLN